MYQKAMEFAGAIVHEYQSFGSYQGDWLARVSFQGKEGYVVGAYGSCSGCDAFEAEFGDDGLEFFDEATMRYYPKPDTDEVWPRFRAFGEDYLDDIKTVDQARAMFTEQAEWDMDAQRILEWLTRVEEQYPTVTKEA